MSTIDTPEMKYTALLPWFGSKRTMAPMIAQELGKHRAYWEPFCGSMAVLLQKPLSGHETVNDLHGELINLARVIQDSKQGPVLYRRLRRVLMDEQMRDEALAQLIPSSRDPIDRAYHYFIVSWFGRNGFSGTRGCDKSSFAVRYTPGGGHGGQRFANAVESIPAWRRRLRRVTILQRDAFEIIEKIDDAPGVAIYVDPPYLEKKATYDYDFEAGYGMFGDDHTKLASALQRFTKARVVVSYYAHPRLTELYPEPQWTHRDCAMNKGIHNAGQRGSDVREAPEVLIINGDSLAK